MRKIITIIIFLMGMGSASAQTPQKYTERLDSIITSLEFGNDSKYVFQYDGDGRLVELVCYSQRDGQWGDPEQKLYQYDEQGRITTIVTHSTYGGRKYEPLRERAEYDTEGHLVSWTWEQESANNGEWYLRGKKTFEYDAQGNQTAVMEYHATLMGQLKEKLKHEKEYDQQGRLITQRDYEFIAGDPWLWRTYSYLYDKQGNLVETKRLFSERYESRPSYADMTIKKTYDQQGRVTSQSTEFEEPFRKDEYYYDTHGNLIQIATFFPFDGRLEHEKNMTFTYDMDTPVSSVMGLSSPGVLNTDFALKNQLNLTCKPLSVYANERDDPRHHEEATYYYSPMEEMVSPTSLSQMDSVKRYEYLVKLAREVIKNFGPGYYREYKKPDISELRVFSDNNAQHPEIQRNVGRKYYTVTFLYDKTQERLEWDYAAQVSIWEDDGEPKDVMFGHNLGIDFAFRPYRQWVKEGIKDDDIMPYQSHSLLRF